MFAFVTNAHAIKQSIKPVNHDQGSIRQMSLGCNIYVLSTPPAEFIGQAGNHP